MRQMFSMIEGGSSFNQDISQWNTSNVTDMSGMFSWCTSFNQPLGNWDVSNVNDMSSTFNSASSFNQDISQWNTGNVTDMSFMFGSADTFNKDIGNWNVSSVMDMKYMFISANNFNQDIGSWNVSNVTDMTALFYLSSSFNQNLSNWDIANVNIMQNMFRDSALSTFNYDSILNSWSQQSVQENVIFGAQGIQYCNGEDARQNLIDNYNWSIFDSGVDVNICKKCLKVEDDDVYLEINNNIVISFYSNQPIKGFQFDIHLPTGFIFNPEDITKLELPDSFNITASNVSENIYRVVGFSFINESIPAGDLPILNLPVLIDSSLPTGDYAVPITDLILSDSNNLNIANFCNQDGILTLYEDPTGDATGDNNINILDILATIDYIFGNPPEIFVFDFADVNSDETINILDILGIQDIILQPDTFSPHNSGQKGRSSEFLAGNNYLIVEDQLIAPNSSAIIEISLVNEDVIKGLQFDFVLPEGITLNSNEINATGRLDNFILSTQEVNTNTFRVLVFSLSSGTIDIGTEPILNLPVLIESAISEGIYPIEFSMVTISDINNNNIATTAPSIGEITIGVLNTQEFVDKPIKLFPNPTKGRIDIQGYNDKILDIILYDILGKQVLRLNTKNYIDISTLKKGVYFMELNDGLNKTKFKIIKI
jgi:surface protein